MQQPTANACLVFVWVPAQTASHDVKYTSQPTLHPCEHDILPLLETSLLAKQNKRLRLGSVLQQCQQTSGAWNCTSMHTMRPCTCSCRGSQGPQEQCRWKHLPDDHIQQWPCERCTEPTRDRLAWVLAAVHQMNMLQGPCSYSLHKLCMYAEALSAIVTGHAAVPRAMILTANHFPVLICDELLFASVKS